MQLVENLNSANLVSAFYILITASDSAYGPSFEEAISLTAHLEISPEWIEAVLFGWSDYAKRYKKPLFRELAKVGSPRFLTVRMLRGIRFTKAERYCRLCGHETFPPKRKWHGDCWKSFEPYSASFWKEICRQAFIKAGKKCELCEIPLCTVRIGRKRHKTYQYDHIIPVALGGANTLANISVLCSGCHREKTRHDMADISAHKKRLLIENQLKCE